jgi:hypothetical protein
LQQQKSVDGEIISAYPQNMKLIRYIRPTRRRTAAWQRAITERPGIAFEVVEGEQGRDWSTALKMLKPGNGLLAAEPETLGRRLETRARRVADVAQKQAWIILADGGEHAPEAAANLIEWMQARGDKTAPAEPRKPHNEPDAETLEKAWEMWTGKDYSRMTNGEIAAATGLSVVTLTRRFRKRSEHIDTRPGRRKKQ